MDAIAAIRGRLPEDGSVQVKALCTKYPQGAERMVGKSLIGREIPRRAGCPRAWA